MTAACDRPAAGAVVHIDDNDGDLVLTGIALEACGVSREYVPIPRADTALALLRDRSARGLPPPSLIIIDVSMHGIDGFTLVEAVRVEPGFEHASVVLMSSSMRPLDRARAQALGVEFRTKPATYHDAVAMISELITAADGGARDADAHAAKAGAGLER